MNEADTETIFAEQRAAMVREQLRSEGIKDEAVLAAMGRVPRHRFVAPEDLALAYAPRPLQIGHRGTISQPYVVARTLELAEIRPGHRVLDVGSGSGYQAAVVAEMGAEVYGIEVEPDHVEAASRRLAELGYRIPITCADGHYGWELHAPYDAIVVGVAPSDVPPRLVAQLTDGGRLVLPVGLRGDQRLCLVRRHGDQVSVWEGQAVRYMTMSHGPADE